MAKRKSNRLSDHIGNYLSKSEYSADVYFVIRDSDKKFVLYRILPDDDLKKEIISAFNSELSKFGIAESAYEIVDILDDNEHDGEYTLFLDNIENNVIAKEVFNVSRKSSNLYDSAVGDYGSIFGFVIELYDGENYIRVFKKNMPTNAIKKSKYIGIFPAKDHKFTNFRKDGVYFSKTIDVINVKEKLFIKNYGVYETNFDFKEVLNRRAAEAFRKLTRISGFFFTEKAIDHFTKFNNSTKKKIVNCLQDNPILEKENYIGIKSQARKHLRYEFDTTADGRIKIDTKKDIETLISILNRDITYNPPAKEVYSTKSKTLLRRFKHTATTR